MSYITLRKCEDDSIWVTSDENQIGTESIFKNITDEGVQMLIALADFLGYEPAKLLNMDCVKRKSANKKSNRNL